MKKIKIKISFVVFGLFIVVVVLGFKKNIKAQTKIFYEDCEDTSFTEWFLERSYGTNYLSYWTELTSEITRSNESPYSGSYCMTYDPWVTGNPHANIGVLTTYGNTSNFDISDVNTNAYYFKWYHRWQTGISYAGSAMNKVIYIGYHEWGGDFVLALEKAWDSGFHLLVMSNPGYVIRINTYPSVDYNLDDMAWHKMEVYIELGTTGPTGTVTVTVDDNVIYHNTSAYCRDAVNINGGSSLNKISWPANTSGTPTGNSQVWLDDLEIWDELPNPTGIQENSKNPKTQISIYPNPFKETSTIEYDLLKASDVIITLHNSQGQKVKTIINSFNNAGKHKAILNASNLPAGIYYYKVNACGSIQTKKCVLMK